MAIAENKQGNNLKYLLFGLALLTFGVYYLFKQWDWIFMFQNDGFVLHSNWAMDVILTIVLLLLFFITGLNFVLRKQTPVKFFYSSIIVLTLKIIVMTFGSFHIYQSRLCDINSTDFCPPVYNEIIGVFLFDLVIYSLGIWAVYLIYKKSKNKTTSKK